jgi:AcrR family transcriptional regulator
VAGYPGLRDQSDPVASAATRDRLLDAAAALFYREGVGVGAEAPCRKAGVSKRSMYQLFASKDVVAAGLDRVAPSDVAL